MPLLITKNSENRRIPGGLATPQCFAAIVLFATLAAGCAHFHPEPLSANKSAAALESRSLTNAALKTYLEKNLGHELAEWPLTKWDFDTLTLAAFYYHPDIALARAQWSSAEGGIKTAGARPNPTLSLVPGYDTTHNPGLSPWFPAVSFDLPLETMGKRAKRIAAARDASESARLNVATAAWQVRNNLRTSLLEFSAAQKREELIQKQLALQEEIVKRTDQRVQAGALASSDALLLHISLQKLQLDFANAQVDLTQARGHLSAALGVPSRALEGIALPDASPDLENAARLTTAEARRTALTSRTDILGALVDYAGTEAALQLQIAKQYPDVHINPGYQFDQGDNKWSIGITFDLPILDQNQGPIAEAEGHRKEAAARFNATQIKVLADIESAVDVFRATEKTSATLKSLAEAEAKQRDSVEAQFNAGAVDRNELLTAESEFMNAEVARLDSELKLQQAAAQLENVIQQPLDAKFALQQAALSQTKQEKP